MDHDHGDDLERRGRAGNVDVLGTLGHWVGMFFTVGADEHDRGERRAGLDLDGPQALAALERQSFDLMLLDLQMPGMRGDEVLQTVRKQYTDTELPVIMLTGSEEKQDITRTLELGANDYVVKPGDLPILLARIHTQLALKAAADKLREHEQFPLGMTAAPLSMTVPPISLSELASDAQASHRRDWSKLRRHSDTFLYDHLPITCLTLNTNLQVLLANQLRFGDMAIFHRHVDGAARSPLLFSVANLVNPGTFDLNRISEFSTRGVCFFMTLPSVGNNMQAFDKMLEAAQQVRIALDADLKDDNRSVMTAQTIEHDRQRVRDFDLRQLRQPK